MMRRGWVCRGLFMLAWLLAQVHATMAEVAQVRSGEHEGFSRLVLDLPQGAEWVVGRGPGGYELRLADPATTFDLRDVFAKIPRSRLTDVAPRTTGSGLLLAVAPGVHAEVSQTAGGDVIIDIADGPAPPDSLFENPLEPPSVMVAADETPQAPKTEGASATLSFRPQTNEAASLPIYWRDVAGADAGPTAPIAVEADPTPDPSPEMQAILPPVIAPPPPEPPPVPSASMLTLEEELRMQLSRAAAQGLAEPPEPGHDRPVAPQTPATTAADQQTDDEATPPTAAGKDTADIAYHAQTSVDRDAPQNPNERPLSSEGIACLTEDDLDLRNWGTEENAADQISRARQVLVGEFDRPDSEAVRHLARLYLYFGLGAEARQTPAAFGLKAEDTDLIADLGQVMDDLPVRSESPLHEMRDCDTPAALWAVLAAPDGLRKAEVNTHAIIRAYSGLPPHLRLLLGRRLSDRLIAIGASDAAQAIRNALARRSEDDARELGMIDAELALATSGTGTVDLGRLMAGNDDVAMRATVLDLQTRLANGDPVSTDQTEAIAALAFEHRRSETGGPLATLEIAARAASGDFDTAFERYAQERSAHPEADHQAVLDGLFTALADGAEPGTFLTVFFEKTNLTATVGTETRLRLSRRLTDLGFAEEVRLLLAGTPAAVTDEGALILAQAALHLSDPGAALALTEGRTDPVAETVKADALAAQGDFSAAAEVYAATDLPERAAVAAWSAGNLSEAAAFSAEHAAMLEVLSPPPPLPAQETPPSLSNSRDRLTESADFRAALSGLLARTDAEPASEDTPAPLN